MMTSTARKLVVFFYNTLRYGMDSSDPGASYYEEQYRQRVVCNPAHRAKQFGYTLAPASTPGVSWEGSSLLCREQSGKRPVVDRSESRHMHVELLFPSY